MITQRVVVIPRDEKAIAEIREKHGWHVKLHAHNNWTGKRPRHTSIPEDEWDYEAIPAYGG